MSKPFLIGDLSKISGVKIPTIRFYEEAGLLPAAARMDNNRRIYGASDVNRLKFVRRARELGFELEAIRALLALQDHPQQSCAEVDSIARARLDDVQRGLDSLNALRNELQRMIDTCASGRVCECKIIESLAGAVTT